MRTRIQIRGLLAGLGLFLATMAPGCGLTGISRSQEISLGQQTAAEIERQYRTYENPTVTRLGQRLAAVSGAPDYPYRFRVIEMSEVNAFALPGGPVYVTSGLMQFAQGRDSGPGKEKVEQTSGQVLYEKNADEEGLFQSERYYGTISRSIRRNWMHKDNRCSQHMETVYYNLSTKVQISSVFNFLHTC